VLAFASTSLFSPPSHNPHRLNHPQPLTMPPKTQSTINFGAAKRPALTETSANASVLGKRPATESPAPELEPPTKITKVNIGGASQLSWYNPLHQNPRASAILQHLASKVSNTVVEPSGCITVAGFTESTRPQADLRYRPLLKEVCGPETPERFSPYVISMAANGVALPAEKPPRYPAELRHVKQKRASTDTAGNEKDATWVCSHLCHFKRCINPAHLRWEPSWMNRLRDNCPGGAACVHRPDPCLAPHRDTSELIDWTAYL